MLYRMREKLRNFIVQGCPVKQIETDHPTFTFFKGLCPRREPYHTNCPSKAIPDVVVPKSHTDSTTGS